MSCIARYFAAFGLIIACHSILQAADVLLFIQPRDDAQIIGRLSSEDPAIQAATEVLDISAAAKGWKWTEVSLKTEGYVPTKSVSKGFEVASGTFVRSQSNSGAIILTTAENGDHFEILSSELDWTHVRFEKPIPVYFKDGAPSNEAFLSATTQTTTVEPIAVSGASSTPSIASFDPNRSVGTTRPSALAPENVEWKAAPAATTQSIQSTEARDLIPPKQQPPKPVVVASQQVAPSERPRMPVVEIGTSTRTFSGKLVREIRNYGPRYPLRLKASNGKRIAYVDISNVFISDLRPYLDRNVFVSGEVSPVVTGSKDLVIYARVLRLAD
ncbi:MAG: hypothetical protein AAGH40_08750 [Verrucomicrobiota bacterium]